MPTPVRRPGGPPFFYTRRITRLFGIGCFASPSRVSRQSCSRPGGWLLFLFAAVELATSFQERKFSSVSYSLPPQEARLFRCSACPSSAAGDRSPGSVCSLRFDNKRRSKFTYSRIGSACFRVLDHLDLVPALAVTVAVAEIVEHLALRMGKIF